MFAAGALVNERDERDAQIVSAMHRVCDGGLRHADAQECRAKDAVKVSRNSPARKCHSDSKPVSFHTIQKITKVRREMRHGSTRFRLCAPRKSLCAMRQADCETRLG